MKNPGFAIAALGALLGAALPASAQDAAASTNLPASFQGLRAAGPLDVQLRTDTGKDVHLRMETQYTTQDFGNRLTSEQLEKLNTIRTEAPDKYEILSTLFPRQIAEFLVRTPSPAGQTPANDALQRVVWEIASDYISRPQPTGLTEGQRRARTDFIRASLASLPAQPAPIQHLLEQASQDEDSDFSSLSKADTFLVLKDGYSPYRQASMSITGDTLRVNGAEVTDRLSADAAAAGVSAEQYAYRMANRTDLALNRWRSGQITGNALAGSIRTFLNDPRLAEFTPEEVSRAYQRVFGRNLKIDLQADRLAEQLGHPVTYNELRARGVNE